MDTELDRIHGDGSDKVGPVYYGVVGYGQPWTDAIKLVHHHERRYAEDTIRWSDRAMPQNAPHRVVTVRLMLVEDDG